MSLGTMTNCDRAGFADRGSRQSKKIENRTWLWGDGCPCRPAILSECNSATWQCTHIASLSYKDQQNLNWVEGFEVLALESSNWSNKSTEHNAPVPVAMLANRCQREMWSARRVFWLHIQVDACAVYDNFMLVARNLMSVLASSGFRWHRLPWR